ncbi:MAG: cardiolipin synthase [Erysipelotrichaceae bacterium]|uniref:cardiolipin synthase n=1 Tax=Floccifex sp. TaxID=2815810 RepID=UPI002A75A0A0|nr:cardiolipin synthase [Floccifex sp.]MDD7280730.1 cardiolipin synthase [Erysipelotrichaceae bacterium]MDY2958368.1 cardiolipin synthase [Floccifex sp.]
MNIKKLVKSKIFYIALAIILQCIFIFFTVYYFSSKYFFVSILLMLFSVCTCIYVINSDTNSSSKLLWVFVIMMFPIMGCILYLLFGGKKIPKELTVQDRQALNDYKRYIQQNQITLKDSNDLLLHRMALMAWNNGYFPLYSNCQTQYFSTGEQQYNAMIHELLKAKDFIFIEFFIINKSVMWDTILQILLDKVQEGVDVRLIYDDFGSLEFFETDYSKWLNDRGIKTHVFNQIKPQIEIQMNNRDHRKIIVIDGEIGFTGGCNISDEYINTKKRFGYWKDMGLMVKGPCVETMTVSFLQIWNYQASIKTDYNDFVLPNSCFSYEKNGFVLPFFDSPTDDKFVGKNMHLNMLNNSSRYFWITTPYLILDSDMVSALDLAVDNGVDVRIIVPGIPDKRMVYDVTKANIDILVRKGVKIYEYTPGFIHGKVCLSDDRNALVGTVNMDFRSYYLHYECGIWMRDTNCIEDIKQDFKQIFKSSHLVTLEECNNVNPVIRIYRSILKIFSPLL